jgi:hypothetical protein
MKSSLDLRAIAEKLIMIAQTENFLYHLAAAYTIDFLWFKSGEIVQQVVKIERRSGHHSLISRPVPATIK